MNAAVAERLAHLDVDAGEGDGLDLFADLRDEFLAVGENHRKAAGCLDPPADDFAEHDGLAASGRKHDKAAPVALQGLEYGLNSRLLKVSEFHG